MERRLHTQKNSAMLVAGFDHIERRQSMIHTVGSRPPVSVSNDVEEFCPAWKHVVEEAGAHAFDILQLDRRKRYETAQSMADAVLAQGYGHKETLMIHFLFLIAANHLRCLSLLMQRYSGSARNNVSLFRAARGSVCLFDVYQPKLNNHEL